MKRRAAARGSEALTASLLGAVALVGSGALSPADATLCDDPRLIGEALEPLSSDEHPRCGADDAVALASVAGVAFEPQVVANCAMARNFADWVETVLAPQAARHLGAVVLSATVYDSYSCRPRNREPGAKLSEHGLANAVDIAGFQLSSGNVVTVEQGWNGEAAGDRAFLRGLWERSCGVFATVLGPEANALHADHFHLDAAERRNPFCE